MGKEARPQTGTRGYVESGGQAGAMQDKAFGEGTTGWEEPDRGGLTNGQF